MRTRADNFRIFMAKADDITSAVLAGVLLIVLLFAGWMPAHATENSSVAPVMPGMKFQAGLVCDHPQLTYDLIKVINNEQMYVDYMKGYGAISGRCIQGYFVFTLVYKWKTTNVSYDKFNVEMWEVKMDDGASMWAIITPDVPEHRVGTAI